MASIWVFLALVVLMGSCENQQSEKVSTTVVIADANPNGYSELASLMLAMFENADSVRSLIAAGEGNISPEFVEYIRQSHAAVPTKPEMKPAAFETFNQVLLNEADALLASDSVTPAEFNSMVDRCMDCHNSICPGPTARIEKLYIR